MTDLKIEKIIARDSQDVFKSLQEGRLFMNCSADSNSIQLDFKVGGKYKLDFRNHKVSNWGEFLEIVPNKKIVFTWCQTFGPDQKPDTEVTIELFPEGSKTRLVLEHKGFQDKSSCDNHYQGWNGGINDLTTEMESGRIRLVRRYEMPVENLYNTVMESKDLFGKIGDFIPNQKIRFEPDVTIEFLVREETNSALDIVQEKLPTALEQLNGRKKWDELVNKFSGMIK